MIIRVSGTFSMKWIGIQEESEMSREYNVKQAMRNSHSSVIGKKEPLPHPQNCKTECPYGYGRAFCFPCMAKIMAEHNAAKKKSVQEA